MMDYFGAGKSKEDHTVWVPLGPTVLNHGPGINIARFDGSASFVRDEEGQLDTYGPTFPNPGQFRPWRWDTPFDDGLRYLGTTMFGWPSERINADYGPVNLRQRDAPLSVRRRRFARRRAGASSVAASRHPPHTNLFVHQVFPPRSTTSMQIQYRAFSLVVAGALLIPALCVFAIEVPPAPEVEAPDETGEVTAAYWVIAYDGENRPTVVSEPTLVENLPDTLSSDNAVRIKLLPVRGATRYEVFKT